MLAYKNIKGIFYTYQSTNVFFINVLYLFLTPNIGHPNKTTNKKWQD